MRSTAKSPSPSRRSPLGTRAALALGIAAVVSAPSLAVAQSAEDWSLVYAAPAEGCPSERAVREGIAQMLGPRWAHEGGPVALRASIAHVDARWILTLLIEKDGARDSRTLEDTQCAPLGDATALIGAMAIDPTVASRITTSTPVTSLAPMLVASGPGSQRGEPPQQRSEATATASTAPTLQISNVSSTSSTSGALPAPSARPTRASQPPLSTTTPPSAPRTTPARWSAGLGASVDTGLLPLPAIGLSAFSALDRGALHVQFSGSFWPERYASAPASPSVGGYLSAYSLRLGAGYAARWSRVSLGILGTLEGAIVRGRGTGVPEVREALSPWVALGAEGRVEIPVIRLISLVISAGAAVPLARPEFFIENVGTLFETPTLTARGAISVELHF